MEAGAETSFRSRQRGRSLRSIICPSADAGSLPQSLYAATDDTMSILSTTRPRTAATTRPEPFLLAHILPHLLAPFPTALPPLVLSRSAQEAVHFLSLSPDSDEYWTLGRKDSQVALRRQELIEGPSVLAIRSGTEIVLIPVNSEQPGTPMISSCLRPSTLTTRKSSAL